MALWPVQSCHCYTNKPPVRDLLNPGYVTTRCQNLGYRRRSQWSLIHFFFYLSVPTNKKCLSESNNEWENAELEHWWVHASFGHLKNSGNSEMFHWKRNRYKNICSDDPRIVVTTLTHYCKTNRFKNSFVSYGLYNWQRMDFPIYIRTLLALNCDLLTIYSIDLFYTILTSCKFLVKFVCSIYNNLFC